MDKPGYVYILKSLKKSRYYIGSCIDVKKRFDQHNEGLVSSTKSLRPLNLEYFQKFETIKLARQIEFRLKKLKSRVIIERIILEKNIRLGI